MQKVPDLSDVMIWLSECLRDVDGINVEWRVLKKYVTDYLDDHKVEIHIKKVET